MSLNGFGAANPKDQLEQMRHFRDTSGLRSVPDPIPPCGIWLLASRINHSCLENCHRRFIGDMQIIRAAQDLPANTELVFNYAQFHRSDADWNTQRLFERWSFVCTCTLCMARKGTSESTVQARLDILTEFHPAILQYDIEVLHQIHRRWEDTLSAAEAGTIRPFLMSIYSSSAEAARCASMEDRIQWAVKALEAGGYELHLPPPHQRGGNSEVVMRQWGASGKVVTMTLITLYKAYAKTAPEVCPSILRILRTAYLIEKGEDETFLKWLRENS